MSRIQYALKRRWWKRFHPLVRVGWITATAGKRRPTTQTAIGVSLMAAGIILRRISSVKPIYTHVLDPDQTVRIRVFQGDNAMSEATVRS